MLSYIIVGSGYRAEYYARVAARYRDGSWTAWSPWNEVVVVNQE